MAAEVPAPANPWYHDIWYRGDGMPQPCAIVTPLKLMQVDGLLVVEKYPSWDKEVYPLAYVNNESVEKCVAQVNARSCTWIAYSVSTQRNQMEEFSRGGWNICAYPTIEAHARRFFRVSEKQKRKEARRASNPLRRLERGIDPKLLLREQSLRPLEPAPAKGMETAGLEAEMRKETEKLEAAKKEEERLNTEKNWLEKEKARLEADRRNQDEQLRAEKITRGAEQQEKRAREEPPPSKGPTQEKANHNVTVDMNVTETHNANNNMAHTEDANFVAAGELRICNTTSQDTEIELRHAAGWFSRAATEKITLSGRCWVKKDVSKCDYLQVSLLDADSGEACQTLLTLNSPESVLQLSHLLILKQKSGSSGTDRDIAVDSTDTVFCRKYGSRDPADSELLKYSLEEEGVSGFLDARKEWTEKEAAWQKERQERQRRRNEQAELNLDGLLQEMMQKVGKPLFYALLGRKKRNKNRANDPVKNMNRVLNAMEGPDTNANARMSQRIVRAATPMASLAIKSGQKMALARSLPYLAEGLKGLNTFLGFPMAGIGFAIEAGLGGYQLATNQIHETTFQRYLVAASGRLVVSCGLVALGLVPIAGLVLSIVGAVAFGVAEYTGYGCDALAEHFLPETHEEIAFQKARLLEPVLKAARRLVKVGDEEMQAWGRNKSNELKNRHKQWLQKNHPDKNGGKEHKYHHEVMAAFLLLITHAKEETDEIVTVEEIQQILQLTDGEVGAEGVEERDDVSVAVGDVTQQDIGGSGK